MLSIDCHILLSHLLAPLANVRRTLRVDIHFSDFSRRRTSIAGRSFVLIGRDGDYAARTRSASVDVSTGLRTRDRRDRRHDRFTWRKASWLQDLASTSDRWNFSSGSLTNTPSGGDRQGRGHCILIGTDGCRHRNPWRRRACIGGNASRVSSGGAIRARGRGRWRGRFGLECLELRSDLIVALLNHLRVPKTCISDL